ncbi:glycosyltransferase [Bradyrhizobium sp. B117]|uniref:glycosyltransferase n=1 Tax=Bradyrhizobium sp. B117 TaxID=3140246 RepID=UPI0031833C68
MSKVSIYIPTHNRQKLLERALNSVRAQTFRDLEIIVVNDASTDSTRDYLDQIVLTEPRLVVVHSDEPAGAAAARNIALKRATGELATGLDDDDEFKPGRVEALLAEWSELAPAHDHISCLFTDSIMSDGTRAFTTIDRKSEVSYIDLFRHNFIGNQIFCPTKRLLSVGGFDESLPAWEDLELFMRLVKRYGAARRLAGEASYICHIEANRARISSNKAKHIRAFEQIIEKASDQPSERHSELFLQLFSSFYGTIPSVSDWRRMLELKAPPYLLAKLLRAALRNSLKKHLTA